MPPWRLAKLTKLLYVQTRPSQATILPRTNLHLKHIQCTTNNNLHIPHSSSNGDNHHPLRASGANNLSIINLLRSNGDNSRRRRGSGDSNPLSSQDGARLRKEGSTSIPLRIKASMVLR